MKKILEILEEINFWIDGEITIKKVKWVQEFNNNKYFKIRYKNPNRIGYNLKYDGILIDEKLTSYKLKVKMEKFDSLLSNGVNLDRIFRRYTS